jgi:hypothetical protein
LLQRYWSILEFENYALARVQAQWNLLFVREELIHSLLRTWSGGEAIVIKKPYTSGTGSRIEEIAAVPNALINVYIYVDKTKIFFSDILERDRQKPFMESNERIASEELSHFLKRCVCHFPLYYVISIGVGFRHPLKSVEQM